MSQNSSSLEEDANEDNEHTENDNEHEDNEHTEPPSPPSDDDDDYELFESCRRQCFVLLERFSEDQIRHITRRLPEQTQNRADLFDQYKKKFKARQKKNAKRIASAEFGDYGFSSSEDVALPPSDDEDYVPEKGLDESCSSRRKRKAYEDDDDWNPNEKFSPRPKKTLRNLRVNTRRKRIESNTSSDEEFNTNTCEDNNDAGDVFPSSEAKEEGGVSSCLIDRKIDSFIDRDVVNLIVDEMVIYQALNSEKSDSGISSRSRHKKRRVSRVIKATDALTPSIKHVQSVVRNIVNIVCLAEEDAAKRICEWCDVLFTPDNGAEKLCKICRDVVKLSSGSRASSSSKKKKNGQKPKRAAKPGATTNKIKSKVLKNLPKYEQRRLMYGEKVPKHSASQPNVRQESNLTLVAAEIHPDPTNPAKKRKLKTSSHVSAPKTKVIKTSKIKILDSGVAEKKSHGVDKKDLLRIDFRGAENSQTITTKQPAANNVQYGTYLLPPVPTVVVANYAANDAKSGDYYLSSVYYQNEMTQAKNVPNGHIATTKANSLPSMPSMDQLSISTLDQLMSMPSISFTPSSDLTTIPTINVPQSSNLTTISTIKFTQSSNLVSVPSVSTGSSVETKVVDSMSFTSQQQASSDDSYSVLPNDLSLPFNNPNLQIQPANSHVALNSDIASLFSNSQLQIEPLAPFDEDMPMETSGPPAEEDDPAPGVGNEVMPPKEPNNSELVPGDQTANDGTVSPKPINKSKENEQSLNNKLNSSEEPSEDLSRKALYQKANQDLDAIGIFAVVDLDINPRHSLERLIEDNKNILETLKSMKPITREIALKMSKFHSNESTLLVTKTMMNTFGCYTNLSNSQLRFAKILQIKQEKIDPEDEEDARSSCQFANSSQPAAPLVEYGQQLDLASIETQISSIAPINPSQYGTVHHFAASRSESRETPSRGSGPLTPARPESAMSSTSAMAEDPVLTPLQIKKERMESEISPTQSQCSFATPSPARTPVAQTQLQSSNPFATPSQSPHQLNPNLFTNPSPTPGNVYQQSNPPAYPTNITPQDTFQILNDMTQRLQNIAPASNQQSYQMSIGNNRQMMNSNQQMMNSNQQMINSNQQMLSGNQQMLSNNQPNMMQHYQPQGRAPGPPNVTLSNSNLSRVLLNYGVRQQAAQTNNAQANNYIFKNGGQIVNIQQQQHAQPNVLFKNVVQQQPQQQGQQQNIMFKNTQMVNVQQVYLPTPAQPRYQAGGGGNQYNLVSSQAQMAQQQQGQLMQQQGQSLVVNNAGQQYSFQQQQMQMQPRVNMQQNQVVQQQNQGVQSSGSQAFMVQNNNRVLLFEIQRPR